MNKRGMFFTFITILLILVILVAFLAKSRASSPINLQKTQAKVTTLNAFVKSFDPVVERAVQASAKQAVLGSLDYMANAKPKSIYIPSFPSEFSKIVLTGKTSSGVAIAKMDDSKIDSLNILRTFSIVKNVSKDSNIYIFHDPIAEQDITIQHLSPWEIEVTLTLKNAKVADNPDINKAELSWSLGATRVIKTRLYVTDYSDPLTLVEDGQQVQIKKSTIQSFETKQDLDNFIASHEFLAHDDGPNFLQRMSGSFIHDPQKFGIEAVLDDNRGADKAPTDSFVDFYYWGNLNDGQASCQVEGYKGKFRLDEKHKIFYTTVPCVKPK